MARSEEICLRMLCVHSCQARFRFQQNNLTFQEVMFLTYDILSCIPAQLIKRVHRFTSNTTDDCGPLCRPCQCTWRAALRRSAVLTRPSRSTRASSVGANIIEATLFKGSGCMAVLSRSVVKRFLFSFRTEPLTL